VQPAPPFPGREERDAERIARLERALAGSHDGFWERNLRTQQSWYSPSFRAMFGFGNELPDDRRVVNARIHPDDIAGYQAAHDEAIDTLQPFSYEVRFRDGLGRWRWVRGRGRVWAGADGRAEIVAGALSDVTEAKEAALAVAQHLEELVRERTARLEAALAQAEAQRAEAERANETKSLFLAHMSHEMRTPLNGVLGLTELALRVSQSPAQQRYLELARQSGHALLKIIDDVLDFSRVEAGKLVLADEPFDLADLLAEAIRGVSPQLRAKGLGWRFDYEGHVTSVRGDRARLRQIITNLLGNAAKFTDHGHVAVLAQLEPLPDARVRTRVHVTDTGPGLGPELLRELFKPFVTRKKDGTGLGLWISRSIVERYGGELHAADRDDGVTGARFTLRLHCA